MAYSQVESGARERIRRLERHLARETRARQEVERLLEIKGLELHDLNRNMAKLNASLERQVEERTRELDRERQRAAELTQRDPLTGLANRFMFREHMEHVLPRIRRGSGVAVLYLDMDGFKGINDMLGHSAGDELLRGLAGRLQGCIREMDLAVRLGGDKFAIVQGDTRQPVEAIILSNRLMEAVQAPFDIEGQRIVVGASIGIALADDATMTADMLLRNAEIAMYRAKSGGRGTWRFFQQEMDDEMQARRALEVDLRRALAEEEFELFYQPLVEAGTEALTGFEALLRWNHPERGMVSPAQFIPLAEEIGLIRPIGAWVLNRACMDAAAWPDPVRVSVNLSPVQFVHGSLVREVEEALAASRLQASRLDLEITESVLLQNSEATLRTLHRLHDLGVRISMDDFGTGYSSLSYLHMFPFDKIKIDQSFVRKMFDQTGNVGIIRAVVALGRAFGMEVLAEGVETEEQLRVLQNEGCNELQGYLFSKPRCLREARSLIARCAVFAGMPLRELMPGMHFPARLGWAKGGAPGRSLPAAS